MTDAPSFLTRVPPCICGGTKLEIGPAPDAEQTVPGVVVFWDRCTACGLINVLHVPVLHIMALPPNTEN